MAKWTKADIDELVAAAKGRNCPDTFHLAPCFKREDLKRTLYLAAGLTAEGQPKPEKVRASLWTYSDGSQEITMGTPTRRPDMGMDVTPGWFVPDGAE